MNSMTGMGRVRSKFASGYLTVEIKSVNHKFCEVNIRMPPRFQMFEMLIIALVKKKLARGKIDIWLGEERSEEGLNLNKKALKQYYQFLKEIKQELKIKDEINLTHIQNGASLWMIKDNDVKKHWPQIKKLVESAIDDLVKMREKEGKSLTTEIERKVQILKNLHSQIKSQKENVFNEHKKKLEKRIEKILDNIEVDQTKLANEIAFFADRSEITEELDRLESHFSQMKKLLSQNKPCGRPLDFLIQEMNREWNTIASKSQHVTLAHWVVEAKSELEKIREQIQNIE